MRIMVDANIIVSAILFKNSLISEILKHMVQNCKIVLSQYTIDEVLEVFDKKFPHRMDEMENFMEKLPYELFLLKKLNTKKYPIVRDIDDIPVLANAIESNVDILVTGDKDFEKVKIAKPKILKPREYESIYMV